MLAPIPSVLLTSKAVFHLPVSMDDYQKPVYEDIEVSHVHIQNGNQLKPSAQNEQYTLKAILFVDGRRSTPNLDYMSLMAASEAVGAAMTVRVIEPSGVEANYTIEYVDALPDVPATRTHHYEIGLV